MLSYPASNFFAADHYDSALSTSAAPYFFKPFRRGTPIREFSDGGLHASLPVAAALEEMKRLWPSAHDHTIRLDMLISVGTGTQEREVTLPSVARVGGFETVCKIFFNSLDTEAAWRDFTNDPDYSPEQHRRLNVPLTGSHIGLDDHKSMNRMMDLVEKQCNDSVGSPYGFAVSLGKVVDQLEASLLYFEPDLASPARTSTYAKVGPQGYELRGTIRCRLLRRSESLGILVRNIDELKQRQRAGRDNVPGSWTQITLEASLRREVRVGDAWFRVPCVLKTQDKDTEHTVAARLRMPNEGDVLGAPLSSFLLADSPSLSRILRRNAASGGRSISERKTCPTTVYHSRSGHETRNATSPHLPVNP